MASVMGTANGIRRIVRLRQMLRNWRNKAKSDVPSGQVAIYAAGRGGYCSRRFVIRAIYLNHPMFSKLLSEAEEEYGFGHNGPLKIPCDESVFVDVIRVVSGSFREISCGKAEEELGWSRNRFGRTEPGMNCKLNPTHKYRAGMFRPT